MTIRLFSILCGLLLVPILVTSCKSDVLKLEEMVDEQCMCKNIECFDAMRKKMDEKFSESDYKKMREGRPEEMATIVARLDRCTERILGNHDGQLIPVR